MNQEHENRAKRIKMSSIKLNRKALERGSCVINSINNKSDFKLNLDLDALFGHMSLYEFGVAFKKEVNLDIVDSKNYERGSAAPDHRINHDGCNISINKLPHIKLGYSNTDFGNLALYLVFSKFTELDFIDIHKDVYELIENTLKNNVDAIPSSIFTEHLVRDNDAKKLNVILPKGSIKILLEKLSSQLTEKDPIIYFETFGNKKSTITEIVEPKEIYSFIYSAFEEDKYPNMFVDICISIFTGNGTIAVANKLFFERISLVPNFSPLFSSNILNLHQVVVDRHLDDINNITGHMLRAHKLNFYCAFKHHLSFHSFDDHTLPLSMELFLTKFHNFHLFAHPVKIERLFKKYNSIRDQAMKNVDGTCLYRNEIRCQLDDIEHSLSLLKTYMVPDHFNYFNASDFFYVLQKNIDNFIEALKIRVENLISLDSIVKCMIHESIFNTMLLNGNKKYTFIRTEEPIQLPAHTNISVAIVDGMDEIVESIFKELNKKFKCELLIRQIKYSGRLSNLEKKVLIEIPEYFYEQKIEKNIKNNDRELKILLNVYTIEKTKNVEVDYKQLCIEDENIDENKKIVVTKAIKERFTNINYKRSTVAKVLFHMYCMRYNYTCEEAIQRLSTFMKDNGVIYVFESMTLDERNNLKLRINYFDEDENRKKIRLTKCTLIDEMISFNNTAPSRIPFDENEIVRWLNGMFRYRNSDDKLEKLLYDFSYGFYPVRKRDWIKNRITSLRFMINNENAFLRIMSKVKSWKPSDFTLKNRICYMNKHGICLNERQVKIYKNLLETDEKDWNNDLVFKNEILSMKASEIFYGVVKNNSFYHAKRNILEAWSNKLITLKNENHELSIIYNERDVYSAVSSYIRNMSLNRLQYEYNNNEEMRNTWYRYSMPQINHLTLKNEIDLSISYIDVFEDNKYYQDTSESKECNFSFMFTNDEIKRIESTLHPDDDSIFFDLIITEEEDNKQMSLELSLVNSNTSSKLITKDDGCETLGFNDDGFEIVDFGDATVEELDETVIEDVEILENTLRRDDGNNLEEIYINKLFSIYRYRNFSISDFKRNKMGSKQRKKVLDWNSFINNLITKRYLYAVNSNSGIYKLNIKSMKAKVKYITFDTIINYMKKFENGFSISLIHKSFTSKSRPSIETLSDFFNDLLDDGYLLIDKITLKTTYYKLSNLID